MADKQEPKKKSGWKKVTRSFPTQGGARRGAAAVSVTEHGLAETNVGGTGIIDRTAVARGIDPSKEYMVEMGVDEEREMIAVYAVTQGGPGATTIRRYKKGASYRVTFHIGAVFSEYPALRPAVKKVKCLVGEELDEDGLPVMTIPIKAGKSQIVQSRGNPSSETAAGEDPLG